ncbi:MAG: 4-alpha-glucanotransferase, partial [Ruminococcaceae bacterium]|nr:4-alpha-glucanotransferase [Oscillospiraceae bacterium]
MIKDKAFKRSSGVLMPIFSLPGEYSCGSFGKEAENFVDLLAAGGFSYWQVLPFCMTDEVNSPYKSYSAFGGNPLFLDLETLYKKGLITGEELLGARQKTPFSCEYKRLGVERLALLYRAASRVEDRSDIEKYIADHENVAQSCKFMAIRQKNGDQPWYEWTTDEYDPDVLFAWQFIQYEFFQQWKKIKKYANEKGIKIIGDIPIYVSYDSADVYFNRDMFMTDSDGKPSCVAGVPPDYFSEDGQLWGNPIYDWEKMKLDGYAWWRARMSHMLSIFDGVRIDHFRGLESYWSIPADAKTAKEGKWVKGPGIDFVRAIKEISGQN